MRSANRPSRHSGNGGIPILILWKTLSRKSTIGASLTPMNTSPQESPVGKPIAAICTSSGARPTKSNPIPPAALMTVPRKKAAALRAPYPWEKWRYRHLEGVRENVELEFVDPSGSGEYHLTRDPSEKDALAHVPGAGLSESELLGLSTKASRFTNTNGTLLPRPLAGLSASMDEFDSLDLFFRVQHPPTRFKDLEAQVSARIVASQIQMDYRFDFLRVTSDTVLVPITVRIANRELSFQSKQGVHSAVLNLYARITTPGGRMVQTFEDIISRDFPESLFQPSLNLSSIYQKAVPLRRGLYRLDIVTKDVHSGNVGVVETALRVPRYEDDKLDASSLILADQLEPVSTRQASLGQFVLGSYKVRPRVNQEFSTTDKMGVFLQLYSLKLDDSSHKTSVSVTYRITIDHEEFRANTAGRTFSFFADNLECLERLDRASTARLLSAWEECLLREAFFAVQVAVPRAQNLDHCFPIFGIHRHADAHCNLWFLAVVRHLLGDSLGHQPRGIRLCLGQHQHKFVSAVTRRSIHLARVQPKNIGQPAKRPAARKVAVCVIDLLEPVQIEHQNCKRTFRSPVPPDLHVQRLQKLPVIGKPRQRVAYSQMPYMFVRPPVFGNFGGQHECCDGHDAHERLQKQQRRVLRFSCERPVPVQCAPRGNPCQRRDCGRCLAPPESKCRPDQERNT